MSRVRHLASDRFRFSGFPGGHRVVGLGEYVLSTEPQGTMIAFSLGSCLGVAICDPVARIGGLLHALLPDSELHSGRAVDQPALFVDTGLEGLIREMCALGAEKHRLRVQLAGGAQMIDESQVFNIGARNIKAAIGLLRREGISFSAEETGGQRNRTLCLDLHGPHSRAMETAPLR